MIFSSFDFLLFFLPVLGAYWLLAERPRARFALLLVCSYFFYCASSKPPSGQLPTPWYYAGLLLLSTVVDFLAALCIHAYPPGARGRNVWMGLSLVLNLGLLAFFKYTGFATEAAGDIASALGIPLAIPSIKLILPIGISFYTFQSLSYTIDVYRGQIKPERSLLRFCLFVAFFPQLVAGPIVRASEFLPQLRLPLHVSSEDVSFAVFRISKGLLKKVVLADFIASYFTDLVFASPKEYSSLENLLALYAFTLQIYADFSGYSDIAVGTARLLGFHLPENFSRPYQSQNVGEFWRRWHMTLSTWLRDYLFFPLGGSLGSPRRTYLNLWITMFLVGMWHGASWNFVIYSNLQAAAMVFSRFNRLRRHGRTGTYHLDAVAAAALLALLAWGVGAWPLKLPLGSAVTLGLGCFIVSLCVSFLPDGKHSRAWAVVHVLFMFHFTTLSRMFFRAETLEEAGAMWAKLIQWDWLGVRDGLLGIKACADWTTAHASSLGLLRPPLAAVGDYGMLMLLVFGLGYHFTPQRWVERLREAFSDLSAPALGVIVAAISLLVSQLLDGPRANIYFAF